VMLDRGVAGPCRADAGSGLPCHRPPSGPAPSSPRAGSRGSRRGRPPGRPAREGTGLVLQVATRDRPRSFLRRVQVRSLRGRRDGSAPGYGGPGDARIHQIRCGSSDHAGRGWDRRPGVAASRRPLPALERRNRIPLLKRARADERKRPIRRIRSPRGPSAGGGLRPGPLPDPVPDAASPDLPDPREGPR